jgi:hypothetical protein
MIAENYVSKNIKIIIIVILAIGLFQHNYKISDMQIIDICNKINCSKKSFATNPINKEGFFEAQIIELSDCNVLSALDTNQNGDQIVA